MFAALMIVQLGAMPVLAAPQLQKTKYEKNGKVEVDFKGRVQYKNVKVTVKDSAGKAYSAYITDRDDDELEFVVKNYKVWR